MLRIYTAITNGVLTMQFAHLLGSHKQLATEKNGKIGNMGQRWS